MTPDRLTEEESAADSEVTLAAVWAEIAALKNFTHQLHDQINLVSFLTVVHASDAPEGAGATFRDLGGTPGLKRAVASLYERVMKDPALAPYFKGTDMARILQRQADMFLALLGQDDYAGYALDSIHRHLHVTFEDFDRLIAHTRATLIAHGVGADAAEQLVHRIDGFRRDVAEGTG